jgi:outer membrane lipoprotein LolB
VTPLLAMRRRTASRALMCALLALSACAQHPIMRRMPPPTANLASAEQAPGRWSGRLALKLQAHGSDPAQGVNVAFDLQGTASSGQLDLSTPLGTLIAQVRWQADSATLTTADGQQAFDSLEELTRRALGEQLPVIAMLSWLEGGPAMQMPWSPLQADARASNNVQPTSFSQAGWQVDTSALPDGLLQAQRSATDQQRGASLKLRLER